MGKGCKILIVKRCNRNSKGEEGETVGEREETKEERGK